MECSDPSRKPYLKTRAVSFSPIRSDFCINSSYS